VRFADLADAGRQLAALLPPDIVDGCMLVAVPPGGVKVGAAVAELVGLPLQTLEVTVTDHGVVVEASLDLEGRRVIVIDDGVETGTAAHAVVTALRSAGAAYVVLAVPVCPREVEAELRRRYDDVIAVTKPFVRRSLRWHYESFA
jgi:predicted phosphoribosyltransferase